MNWEETPYEHCCVICEQPLKFGETDICEECFFETTKPWGAEELMEQSNDDDELKAENKALQEKLNIAVKALEKYARRNDWYNCRDKKTEDIYYNSGYFLNGYETAQEALAKIKEIK